MFCIQKLTYDKISFKTNPAKITAILAYMAATIKEPQWDLSLGRYILWGFREQALANNIKSVDVQQFCLRDNEIPMLIELVGIEFRYLKKLNLDGNNIESIQSLSQISAPALVSLSLNRNNINCIVGLRKCYFQQLQTLSIKQNSIHELRGVGEWNFPNFCELLLQSSSAEQNPPEDLSNLAKVKCSLDWLFVVSAKRIKQCYSVVKQIWPNCQVKSKTGRRRYAHNIRNDHLIW